MTFSGYEIVTFSGYEIVTFIGYEIGSDVRNTDCDDQ